MPDVRTRLRWLGHSTVLADVNGTRVVTDPVLRRRVLHLRRDAEVAPPGEVDAILVSHLHYDHLDLPSLARIGVGTPIVIPRGGRKLVRGFERVTEVQPGVELSISGLRISVVEAQHEGRRRNLGAFIPAVGYILEGTHRIYFAGDTDLFDGMRDLAPLDVALLPVWGWGPKVGAGHLDPERAAAALPMLQPRIAVPIHWGTYRVIGSTPVGSEPAQAFALAAHRTAPDVDVRVLPLGGALEL